MSTAADAPILPDEDSPILQEATADQFAGDPAL